MKLNLFLISFGIAVLFLSGLSSALVVENLVGMPANEIPHNSVGKYAGGGTASVISPNHIITAGHIDQHSTHTYSFKINDIVYYTSKVYNSDTLADLKIVEISPEQIAEKGPLPKPYVLISPTAPDPKNGDVVYMVGQGQYALAKLPGNLFDVTSETTSTYPIWGMNRLTNLYASNSLIKTIFSSPTSSTVIPNYEAQTSLYDSGGGIYAAEPSSGKTLILLGVIITSFPSSGDITYAYSTDPSSYGSPLRASNAHAWIRDVFENQSTLGVKPVFLTSSGLENAKIGDVDLNGKTDLSDFAPIASHFGEDITDAIEDFGTVKYTKLEMWNRGDFNADEKVNMADWNLFLANYGK